MPTQERLPRRYTARDNDIFALIKHPLCDDHLSQPALLIWPGDMTQEVQSFWRRAGAHAGDRAVLPDERADALKSLAQALENYPQYGRAIRFYRGLANGELPKVDARPLDFINVGGVQAGRLAVAHALPPRDPRPNPYELRVRFRRGRGRG